MREIKFRAWQINHKNMCKVKNIHFNDNGDIESVTLLYPESHAVQIITYSDSNERFWIHDKDGICVLELMQYTGLKDKKGVEIYEGDILNYDNGIGVIGTVIWYGNGFVMKVLGAGMASNKTLYNSLEDIKVIGNIYESPELLKREGE